MTTPLGSHDPTPAARVTTTAEQERGTSTVIVHDSALIALLLMVDHLDLLADAGYVGDILSGRVWFVEEEPTEVREARALAGDGVDPEAVVAEIEVLRGYLRRLIDKQRLPICEVVVSPSTAALLANGDQR